MEDTILWQIATPSSWNIDIMEDLEKKLPSKDAPQRGMFMRTGL